jgi:4-hydroxy-3-polyprenylbenzoate decarboxylase
MNNSAITLAITGASGVVYGFRLLEQLIKAQQTVYLLLSTPAYTVIQTEMALTLPEQPLEVQALLAERYQAKSGQLQVFGQTQWMSPVASGSANIKSMVICPCTGGTLGAIANGLSRSLIERAAEVILKEQRQLILVSRETPVSVIQLENMLRLARAGALILPANPGFYYQPQQINDLVDFIVGRILDHLDIHHNLIPRWGQD